MLMNQQRINFPINSGTTKKEPPTKTTASTSTITTNTTLTVTIARTYTSPAPKTNSNTSSGILSLSNCQPSKNTN